MKNNNSIIDSAIKTLQLEATSVLGLTEFIDDSFSATVNLVHAMKGRLIISGIGKSAIIAQKIVATLNSTGTPAVFMHAADAIHGDLGLVLKDDVVLIISKSGNSPEIKVLSSLVKSRGNILIGMAGNMTSDLATKSDHVLNTTVSAEACPNNLAPTSSTTAQMAMGDALAVCLMDLKGFGSEDFAKHHPGGALGKKLFVRINDVLVETSTSVSAETKVKDVILAISSSRQGATTVVDGTKILGIVTDGDLRRMLESNADIHIVSAADIMTKSPKQIELSELAAEGFRLMEKFNITQLVVTENKEYRGLVHLHDILKEGIY
ncbi:MAG TPA: D-arabinose 5-phosphate isomerase [Flavobacteriales bacterium]|nr:D-arabinose 5-phosphate isomerase [Flavobacteriales bacterium]